MILHSIILLSMFLIFEKLISSHSIDIVDSDGLITDVDYYYACGMKKSGYEKVCSKIFSFKVSQENSYDCYTDTILLEQVNGHQVSGWILPDSKEIDLKELLTGPVKSTNCKLIRR